MGGSHCFLGRLHIQKLDLEEVVATPWTWRRLLSHTGLVAGCCHTLDLEQVVATLKLERIDGCVVRLFGSIDNLTVHSVVTSRAVIYRFPRFGL